MHNRCSNDMTSPSSSMEWAKTLVGRDWEIFWSQGDDGSDSIESGTEKKQQQQQQMSKDGREPGKQDSGDHHGSNKEKEGSEDDEDGSVIDDWYAGHVHSMRKIKDGEYSFEVRFVGEEDDLYNMILDASKVRPSARGWIKRTRSLICVGCAPNTPKGWEEKLPPDTRTIADEKPLEEIRQKLESQSFPLRPISLPKGTGTTSFRLPTVQDLTHVRRLQYLVQCQIVLRTRLAAIENHHGSTKLFVDGEPNPTESYVDQLVACLEQLDTVCNWYCTTWYACQNLLSDMPLSNGGANDETKWSLDTVLNDFLEAGRIAMINFGSMHATPSPTKKRSAAPAGTRRTKRRRKQMKFGHCDESFLDTFDESDFLTTAGVDQFIETMYSNDGRWFLRPFGSMLQTLSHYIIEPLLAWQRQARLLLREDHGAVPDNLLTEDVVVGDDRKLNSDSDGSDAMSDEEDEGFFSYEDIQECLDSAAKNTVLNRIDFSQTQQKLQQKLTDIDEFEERVRHLIKRILDEDDGPSQGNDEVLTGLKQVSQLACSSKHAISNIDPFGIASSPYNRDVLVDAVSVRTWLLDLRHAEQVRERVTFIQDLSSRAPKLSQLPALAKCLTSNSNVLSKWTSALERTEKLFSDCSDCLQWCERHHASIITNGKLALPHRGRFMTINNAAEVLDELKETPFLTIAEEKLAVRIDALIWNQEAIKVMADQENSPGYDTLIRLHESLQLLLDGKSRTRNESLQNVQENEEVEADIQSFGSSEIDAICGTLAALVQSLYSTASKWKDRAETVISSLRMHGNAAAGELLKCQKLPAMVDIRRIQDLLDAYGDLRATIPGYTNILEKVLGDATKWSKDLEEEIIDETQPLSHILCVLEEQRDRRPRGIIMDPTRHVFDMLLDLLGWHKRATDTLISLASDAERIVMPDAANADALAVYSEIVGNVVYPLLIDGCEIIEEYSKIRESPGQFKANSTQCIEVLENLHELRKSARALSREKLQSNPLGSALLARMLKSKPTTTEGAPLFLMLWFNWDLLVEDFVAHCSDSSDDEDESDRPEIRSLADAKQLKALEPTLSSNGDDVDMPPYLKLLLRSKTSDQIAFESVITEADQIENDVRSSLAATREMLRGSLKKADAVRDHLAKLKELQSLVKHRSRKGIGVSLNSAIEPQIEYHVKIFTWLVKTFAYPLLHLDEASYSATIDSDDDDAEGVGPRIPYDVLVSLFDRIPGSEEERTGDFALVALRVGELYEAARSWQDEITNTTSISIRGGKRRAQGSPSSRSSEVEQDPGSQLEMGKVQRLARNPILSKVVMPREGAVNGILKTSKQFEILIRIFLGKDYEGSYVDLAADPKTESLVGRRGEFILYRLTKSTLFDTLLSSVQSISNVADNLLAETPGKVAFEWIRSAISWIERLDDAVTSKSPFEDANVEFLSIPGIRARELLAEGREIFLNLPEDLPRTLSRYRLHVSTNKQDEKLKVSFRKGGTPHSVGGTAIRWCPILFECLKADVARLDEWERDLTRILGNFNRFFSETRAHTKGDENHLYRWHEFREQVSELLEEGVKSLVVSPQKGLADSFRKLLHSINSNLERYSNKAMERKFARRRYDDSASLVSERFLLLECLLYRKAEAEKQKLPVAPQHVPQEGVSERSFRDTCRIYIERALTRGCKLLGIESQANGESVQPKTDLLSYCTIKAWEIENEMFDRFQGSLGVNRVSDEYRGKARSLRYSLEDKSDQTLCLRVLLGDIDVAALVNMTADQLASQKLKRDRAPTDKATSKSVSSTVDTEQVEVAALPPTGDSFENNDTDNLEGKTKSSNATPVQSIVVSSGNDTDASAKELHDQVHTLATNSAIKEETSPSGIKNISKVGSSSSRLNRPPPPPSLAPKNNPPAVTNTTLPQSTSRDRGKRITNSIGGDRFQIEINKPRIVFVAGFYLEDDSMTGVNSFVPEILNEKGRLKIEEFERFLAEKLSGGRWSAIPLRLTTFSDSDAKEYRKFYKEYESKKRIAMFAINGQNSKVFLVTPRFHGAATKSGLISFSNKTSTYALVLTKERLRS